MASHPAGRLQIRHLSPDEVGEDAHALVRVELLVDFLVPGTDVMIFKIFSPKNSAKKWTFFTQKIKLNYAKF
jgi:hypothetical protein